MTLLSLPLLILGAEEVEPLGNAPVDGIELFTLSALSLLQLGHECSQLLFPLVSKCCDGVQILCVLQKKKVVAAVIRVPLSALSKIHLCNNEFYLRIFGAARLPLRRGKCCSALLFFANSAHRDAAE